MIRTHSTSDLKTMVQFTSTSSIRNSNNNSFPPRFLNAKTMSSCLQSIMRNWEMICNEDKLHMAMKDQSTLCRDGDPTHC